MPSGRPLALVAEESRGERVSAVNPRARRDGIRPGMALADARAMLPALMTRPAEPVADRALLMRLARWSGRYGPARNREGPDGLWIDVTGVAHLFARRDAPENGTDALPRGERALCADLARRLAAAGLSARIGLADTPGAAHALARFADADIAIAPPGTTAPALAALPVEALRLAPEAVLLLRRLGLARIGALYDLPRAALERRFRDTRLVTGVRARLDQALGCAAEPRRPLAEPPVLSARQCHAEPLIAAAAIEAHVRQLADEFAQRLAAAGLGLRRLVLSLYRTDATVATLTAGTSRACRDADHIYHLIADKLPAIDAGFGIDALVLDAAAVERLEAAQVALGPTPGTAEGGADRLVDRLANRLGPQRVQRLLLHDSHLPERAARAVPALLADGAERYVGRVRPPRPPWLLAPPEPIAVMAEVPEGAPLHFTWRRRMRRIVKAEGPERIAPEWWRALAPAPHSPRVRDYYRLEDEAGGRYWVFRAGRYDMEDEAERPPAWYVHGVLP